MRVVTDRLVENVEKYYKHFFDKNDKAHNLTHIRDVYRNILYINDKAKLHLDSYMMLMAAYMHDVMVWKDRKIHHTEAMNYVLTAKGDKYLNKLTEEERIILANAVNEHRSSGSGIYSSDLSEALAAADKGLLKIDNMLIRSYIYHEGETSCNINLDAIDEVIHHHHEKFGSNGYAKYGVLYYKVYGDTIKDLQKQVDNLTKEYVIKIIKEYKENECK